MNLFKVSADARAHHLELRDYSQFEKQDADRIISEQQEEGE